ncbi:MAG: type II CRISPR-associated endonuclease Cas1 [Alphaproteobacteria bacterium]|nr:MAG: type II CRISPR-associated endonuclease Cas1 [Alphaproteobacteria bacterium]
MLGRVIEIAEDGRHLAVFRGFLKVTAEKQEIARIPLDEIAVIMAHAHQLSYSNNLLVECCNRGIAFMFTGSNHTPAGFLWPTEQHHAQAGIMQAQLTATQPLCKQLWKQLISAKIYFQGEQLHVQHGEDAGLYAMSKMVKSGDIGNLEAQAARRYWQRMMGKDFTRNQDDTDIRNKLLNYGYAILRSTTARAIMAAGLHPTLGIFHRSRINTMCLVDDVMEPFRPLVDAHVLTLIKQGVGEVDKVAKTALASIHLNDVCLDGQAAPLGMAVLRVATSLAESYQSGKARLLLPESLMLPKNYRL